MGKWFDQLFIQAWCRSWSNGYHRWNWARQLAFESIMKLFAFPIVLIPFGKAWNGTTKNKCPVYNTKLRLVVGIQFKSSLRVDYQFTAISTMSSLWQITAGRPPLSQLPNLSWPSDRLVVSLISGQGYFTFFMNTQNTTYTTERVEEKRTNKHGLWFDLSARREKFVTLS